MSWIILVGIFCIALILGIRFHRSNNVAARVPQGEKFSYSSGEEETIWSNEDFFAIYKPCADAAEGPSVAIVQINSDTILDTLDQSYADFETPEEAIEVVLDYLAVHNLVGDCEGS